VLLAVPDPLQPWVIAGTMAATCVLAMLLGDDVAAVWDRQTLRTLSSTAEHVAIQNTITDLRAHIAAASAALEPHRNDAHLNAGQQIEYALTWLDAVEHELSQARD
jgi:hypothetical protein